MSCHKSNPYRCSDRFKILIIYWNTETVFMEGVNASTIIPHNATTFVGTNIELEKLHALGCKPDDALSNLLASKAVDWRYLQRRQSNFGGF